MGANCFPTVQVFTYFGLRRTILELLLYNPLYKKYRGTDREKKVGSFWNSREYVRINTATGGALDSPDNSTYELGYDDASIFNIATHSTGFIFLR
jgi:hypothetical protein